jgi:hypothetical protein
MKGALLSDWIKMRRTWIKILVFLCPFGVVSLESVRYAIFYNRIVIPSSNTMNWVNLIGAINELLLPSLILGIALLTGLEHQGNTWKQLLALPISRVKLYASKFIWLIGFLAISASLCAIGTTVLGLILGFGIHAPWLTVLKEGFYPYLTA